MIQVHCICTSICNTVLQFDEDVYDGRLYQKLSAENGFLSNPDNLSLLGNTDGVALVRSSRAGVWPIYYVINELPPRERYV